MKQIPPNQYRHRNLGPLWSSTDADGMNGAFAIPLPGHGHRVVANCIVSNGDGLKEIGQEPFEHVSVHIVEYGQQRTPTWEEMCQVKDIFWDDEECVVQYHPPKSEYVNNHPHVLHLWKWLGGQFPRHDKLLVGIQALGNIDESITCPQCGRTSHHPDDVRERYCGHCHQWHKDMKGKT